MKLLLNGNSPDWLIDMVKNILDQEPRSGFWIFGDIKNWDGRDGFGPPGRIMVQNAAAWFNQRMNLGNTAPMTGCVNREHYLEFEFEETPELTMLLLQDAQR